VAEPAEIDERRVVVEIRECNDGVAVEVRAQISDRQLHCRDFRQGARAERGEAIHCRCDNVPEHRLGRRHALGICQLRHVDCTNTLPAAECGRWAAAPRNAGERRERQHVGKREKELVRERPPERLKDELQRARCPE